MWGTMEACALAVKSVGTVERENVKVDIEIKEADRNYLANLVVVRGSNS